MRTRSLEHDRPRPRRRSPRNERHLAHDSTRCGPRPAPRDGARRVYAAGTPCEATRERGGSSAASHTDGDGNGNDACTESGALAPSAPRAARDARLSIPDRRLEHPGERPARRDHRESRAADRADSLRRARRTLRRRRDACNRLAHRRSSERRWSREPFEQRALERCRVARRVALGGDGLRQNGRRPCRHQGPARRGAHASLVRRRCASDGRE